MAGDKKVEITISARDLATGVFARAKASVLDLAAGFASGQVAVDAFYKAVALAQQGIQEFAAADEVAARLATAFRNAGANVAQASARSSEFASQLQRVTKYSDDATLEAQALLVSIGKLTGDGLERATMASADLAAAMGVDIVTAATAMAKAAAGNTSALGKLGFVVKDAEGKTASFEKTLEAIERQLGGTAIAAGRTAAGQLERLTNAWKNFQESVGRASFAGGLGNYLEVATDGATRLANALDELSSKMAGLAAMPAPKGYGFILSLLIGSAMAGRAEAAAQLGASSGRRFDVQLPTVGPEPPTMAEQIVDEYIAAVQRATKAAKDEAERREKINRMFAESPPVLLDVPRYDPRGAWFGAAPLPTQSELANSMFPWADNTGQPLIGEDAISSPIMDAIAAVKEMNAEWMKTSNLVVEIAASVQGSLASGIYGILAGTGSIGERLQNLFDSLYQTIMRIIAEMIAAKLIGGALTFVGGLFGGPGGAAAGVGAGAALGTLSAGLAPPAVGDTRGISIASAGSPAVSMPVLMIGGRETARTVAREMQALRRRGIGVRIQEA